MKKGETWQRRKFLKASAVTLGMALPPKLAAASACVITPSTEDGPLYPAVEIPWTDDLTTVPGQDGMAKGQIAYLFGRVKSADCRPVSDATVETWQADDNGYYDHPRHDAPDGLDPCFRYFGKVRADDQGRFMIKTIVPSWYRIFDIDRAAHIHMKVRSPSNGVLTTEVYFSGEDQDEIRERDPVYQSRRRKELLIADTNSEFDAFGLDIPDEDGAAYCQFDVMYRI